MSTHGRTERTPVLHWAYLAWLAWLPLPLGSNRPVWLAVALAGATLIFITWLLGWMSGRVDTPRALYRARYMLLGFACILAWQAAQMLLPGSLAPDWVREVYALAGIESHSIAIDRSAAVEALWHSVLVLLAFVSTLLLVNGRRQAYRMLWLLVWLGTLMAILAGVTVMEGRDREIMGIALNAGSIPTGSFINRNHFANYLVLALAAGIGLLIGLQSPTPAATWRERLRRWSETLLGPKARLRIFLALMVISLVLTRSRMGNTSFFAGLLIAGGLALWLIRGRHRGLALLISSLLVIDLFIVGTWFGVEQVIDRIEKTVVVTEDRVVINEPQRMEANREALDMIGGSPWTGMGGGAWRVVFPAWRAADQGFFDHAHDDYLEFAVDLGVPAAILGAVLVLLAAGRSLLLLARRRDPLVLGSAFACLMAVAAVGIHATVEFNLHIPANAATFAALLALPFLHRRRSRGPGAGPRGKSNPTK